MTYLQTHRRPHNSLRGILTFVVVFIVAVIVLIQILVPRFFPGLFVSIARPFWRTEFSIENGGLETAESLLAQKSELSRQLDEMKIRMSATHSLEIENEELKKLLGRSQTDQNSTTTSQKNLTPSQRNGILAAVLSRPPVSGYDQLIIDIGSDHGISTSTKIFIQGDMLIGKVVDVFKSTAKVRLFTSPGESIPVLIGDDHIAAAAIGRGGGYYEAEVSRDAVVEEGDFVLDSTFGDRPLGIVSAVLLDPTQPFKTVLFAPTINVYQIRWVIASNHD